MLEIESVSKTFRRGHRLTVALEEVSLSVANGEFLTIVGPSGCGKSTLLHLIAGFERPTTGEVRLNGARVEAPGRDRGMVFQHACLFPWRTVEGNVAWPIEVTGVRKRAARAQARELLALVGLRGFEASYPGELSGGMRQRAALARTLALDPTLLLMDEPFGALDAQTRELMQEELNRIWQEAQLTVVFITHDITEAIFLGDRVVVMGRRPGRIIDELDVDFDRPRQPEIKTTAALAKHHARLWDVLRTEMLRGDDDGP